MDILVLGALGVAGFYLLQRPGFASDEGALKEAQDYTETEGIVKPNGTLGDLSSQNSLSQQRDMETDQLMERDNYTRADFTAWMKTPQGQTEYQQWLAAVGKPHGGSKHHPQMLINKFEDFWRSKHHNPADMRTQLKLLNKRNTLNASVVSTNAFNPDRFVQVRNRPNGTPYIFEFATDKTLGGKDTYVPNSPYTLQDYTAIPETPYASDRTGVRTERDTHIDITPVVATAMPVEAGGGADVGAVRMNFGNMQSTARKVRFNVNSAKDPASSASSNLGGNSGSKGTRDDYNVRHKRVVSAY